VLLQIHQPLQLHQCPSVPSTDVTVGLNPRASATHYSAHQCREFLAWIPCAIHRVGEISATFQTAGIGIPRASATHYSAHQCREFLVPSIVLEKLVLHSKRQELVMLPAVPA
jgi:hypothetical protein